MDITLNTNEDELGWDIHTLIRKRFSPGVRDDVEREIEAVTKLISYSLEPGRPLRQILEMAANTIRNLCEFREVSIGLRSEKDGLFRYEVLIGFKKTSEIAHRLLSYTLEDMLSDENYPNVKLSKFTEYCFAERKALEETDFETYNHPC